MQHHLNRDSESSVQASTLVLDYLFRLQRVGLRGSGQPRYQQCLHLQMQLLPLPKDTRPWCFKERERRV